MNENETEMELNANLVFLYLPCYLHSEKSRLRREKSKKMNFGDEGVGMWVDAKNEVGGSRNSTVEVLGSITQYHPSFLPSSVYYPPSMFGYYCYMGTVSLHFS